jgi:uncharacterized protein YjbI with pentapeptide repeats
MGSGWVTTHGLISLTTSGLRAAALARRQTAWPIPNRSGIRYPGRLRCGKKKCRRFNTWSSCIAGELLRTFVKVKARRKTLCRALILASALTIVLSLPPAAFPGSVNPPTLNDLQQKKLQEEVRQLRLDNQNHTGMRGFVGAYGSIAGFATALAALIGVLVTYRKGKSDESMQQSLDRQQQKKEREQREIDSQRRLDERFSSILTDLGSTSKATQAAAAVSLLSFLRPDRDDFHHQVRLVTLANLKVDHDEAIAGLLIRVFEAAARTPGPLEQFERNFAHAYMRRIDLSGIDLQEADIAYAQMRGANLSGANLRRARGYKVELRDARLTGEKTDLREVRFGGEADCARANFCEANLRAAHLKGAILTGAQFQRARLQSAHLEGADIAGAQFEQCDLNDTYFNDVKFDEGALKTITRARNWEKAHFTDDVKKRLLSLAGPG